MSNYDILFKLLDCDSIIEYTIRNESDFEDLATNLTKSQAYDFLEEHKLKIIDISIDPFCNFVLLASAQ